MTHQYIPLQYLLIKVIQLITKSKKIETENVTAWLFDVVIPEVLSTGRFNSDIDNNLNSRSFIFSANRNIITVNCINGNI